jgi:digeranylgeranylglycerophospholipid reductase
MKTDVLVVGAGPAGTVAARYAAATGASVTVLERRPDIGVPVRCGEFMPDDQEIEGMFPLAEDVGTLFDIPGRLKIRETEAIRLITPKGRETYIPFNGYTTDRDEFDRYLASMAEKEGAEIMKGCLFKNAKDNVAFTSKGEIGYDVLIGADGPGSRVAQTLGLPRNKDPYPAVTAQAEGDFDPVVTMFFGGVAPGAYGWIIPKKGKANVGIGFSPKFASGTLSGLFEKFADDHGLSVISRLEGKYVPSRGPISRTVEGSGMVVGDAAGHVISVNGGGLPLALIAGRVCGTVAGDNISGGRSLTDYEKEWRRIMLGPLMTAASNKKLADLFAFGSDRRTEICMRLLGKRRLSALIRCGRIFP